MPIHNQSALRSGTNLKRILISNRYNLYTCDLSKPPNPVAHIKL